MATIFGTYGADVLIGTRTADAIYGLGGDDSISGVQGRDFIYGGNGNDTLDGGGGNDVIDGGGGFDLALYSGYTTAVWADLRTGAVEFPDDIWPGETLIDVEAINGGDRNDQLVGNGAANAFWGNNGNDTLVGNLGADTLIGGAGTDSLDGGNGPDTLTGGLGDDTMLGGLHDDVFAFAPIASLDVSDTPVLVDFGTDRIDGGAGTDTVYVEAPELEVMPDDPETQSSHSIGSLSVRANLGAGTLRLGDSANRSTLVSIENIETGSGDDSVNGSNGDNLIISGDGADVVYAGSGDDTIIGGTYTYGDFDGPSEVLNGGAGNDLIIGGGAIGLPLDDEYSFNYYSYGKDMLNGADGDDTLVGGPGYQELTGGSGKDKFVLTDEVFFDSYSYYITNSGATITDFSIGETIDLRVVQGRWTTLRFVGESRTVQGGQITYTQQEDGTTINVGFPQQEGQPVRLHIYLEDYTGPVTADIFGL